MMDYGVENNKSYRYILAVTDFFSINVWGIPLKTAQFLPKEFSIINDKSNRKPNFVGTDVGKNF